MSSERPARRRRVLWPWLSLLPLGLGAWAPIIAGVRCDVRRWTVIGLAWSALTLAGWISLAGPQHSSTIELLTALLLMVTWVGGAITSFAIRPNYKRRMLSASKPERTRWPKPTTRSREWSVRYALIAYVGTFAATIATAAALYFWLGIRLRVGISVLLVDVMLLGALLPLRRKHGLSRQDLGLRTVPAARSVGLVILALIAYVAIIALWLVIVHPHGTSDGLIDISNQSTINVVLAAIAASVCAPVVEEISSAACCIEASETVSRSFQRL